MVNFLSFFFFSLYFFFSKAADVEGASIVNQFVVVSLILGSLLLFKSLVLVETQNYILECGTLDKKG